MSLEEVSIEDNSDALSAARLQIRTEGDWLYCQRRLDELEAQVEILRRRTACAQENSDSDHSDLAEENALLRAQNRSLIREMTALQRKSGSQAEPSGHDFAALETEKITLPPTSATLEALHRAVANLPSCSFSIPPHLQSEGFVLAEGEKLDEFLAEAAPGRNWAKFNFFFFPARTIPCTYNPQHYLTFAPRGQTIPNTKHRIQPRFNHLLGQEHPLFVSGSGQIKYAGSYVIKKLSDVAPDGCKLPIHGVDVNMIVNLAMRELSTGPHKSRFLSKNEFYDMYKRGELQVECAALQFVGFDMELHTKIQALEKERASSRGIRRDSGKRKRSNGDDTGRDRQYRRSSSPKMNKYMSRDRSRSSGSYRESKRDGR